MAKYYDTIIGEYLKNPGARGLSLDKLASRDLEYQMISYDELTQKGKVTFDKVDLNIAKKYSGEDVYITHKLFESQKNIDIYNSKVLKEIELPLMQILKDIELNGVCIDRDILKGIGTLLENEVKQLEKEILDIAGEEFNIKSPKQVGDILFEKLGLPKGKKTKTGYSVSAEVLNELAREFPIAEKIVTYRHYSKLLSTYIEGLLKVVKDNDLVYTSYSQTIPATGSLSCVYPILQNIPSSDGIAGDIRKAFVSRFENGKLLAFDYSQVEVRILAYMSGDNNLLNAFNKEIDIHQNTGELIFQKNEISSGERKIAKAVNFGIIYGISAFGLMKNINISMKEAKEYIDKFYSSYPQVKEFFDKTIENCKQNGYVETLFGRRRPIPGINDKNQIIANAAKREAINMPIQGTAADIIKLAMIEVQDFIKEKKLKSLMIMQVHDELVFDVYPGEDDILKKEIKKIMESILKTDKISLKVDIGEGNNWKETK